jgi:hypothetical protein
MAGQIILSVAYGIDVRPEGDPFVEDAEKVLHALEIGSTQEAALFDMIPWCNICRFLPLFKERHPVFTDSSGSTPYAELVSRSSPQASCAQVVPHCRQCSTDDTRQGEGRSRESPLVSHVHLVSCRCLSVWFTTSHIRLLERLLRRLPQI